jgi:hypothetical protein
MTKREREREYACFYFWSFSFEGILRRLGLRRLRFVCFGFRWTMTKINN